MVVAAEGGGIRAGYWAAVVLAKLEDEIPGLSCHVYAVSGVSGGSLGGAVYAALLADRFAGDSDYVCDGRTHDKAPADLVTAVNRVLGEDFLAPVMAGLLFPDLMQRFWPIPGPGPLSLPDRAKYLEMSWEASWRKATNNDRFAAAFLDLWEGETAAGRAYLHQVPSLLLNGTWVETGGRAVTSNLDVEAVEEGHDRFVQLEDVLREVGAGIALSTAAHMSARFTLVSPAGTIDTRRGPRRIVDGGYFENSGGLTASELVASLIEQCPGRACGQTILPIGLYIKNGSREVGEIAYSHMPLAETLSPALALLNTRGARGRHAEALLRASVDPPHAGSSLPPCRIIESGHVHNCFYPFYLEADEDVSIPLGWVLSGPVQDRIHAQLEDLSRIDELRDLVLNPEPATATVDDAKGEVEDGHH